MSKKRLWLFLVIVLFVTADLLVSLWFFVPSFKNRLLAEYYTRRYPNMPQSEFRLNPNKVTHSADGSYSYISNNRFIKVNGMTTTVLLPDGKTEIRYLGKVTSLPRDTWEELIGATNSASINTGGQAVDLKNRRVAISQNGEKKIISIPTDTIVGYKRLENLSVFTRASLEDLRVGDTVQFLNEDLPYLVIIK